MAEIHGHRIVTDGLVMYVDAANVKSFRGEPTTNLFTNHTTAVFSSAYNGSAYGFGASTNIQQVVDSVRLFSDSIITKVSRINSGVSQYDYVLFSVASEIGTTKTLSFWYYGTYGTSIYPYNNDGCADLYYLDDNEVWQGGATAITIPVLVNEWKHIIIKMVNKGSITGTGLTWIRLHNDSVAATLDTSQFFSFTRWQVEEKDHATPFVVGTRGTTVATGGGFGDLTSNHHGTIANSPLYSSSNNGCLLFDGGYNYITFGTGNDFFPMPEFTIDAWVKSSGLGSDMSVGGVLSITYGIGFNYIGDGVFRFYIDNGSTFTQINTTGFNAFDGVWHNIVAYNTGARSYLYIDGVYNNSGDAIWLGTTRWPTNIVCMGIDANNHSISRLSGYIGSLKVYKRVLSNAEILQNYNAIKGRYS